jgi:hypothetical protein
VEIKLDSWLLTLRPERYREPGAYEYTWGRIHLDTQYANPLNQSNLRHRIAHEVFHAMQREVIGRKWGSYSSALAYHWWHEGETVSISNPYLWWVEASAEYASCRVPWRLEEIGGTDYLYPRMLEYPLPFTGAPPGQTRFGDLEYDKGIFIEYLIQQHGFNLKDMLVSAKAALASSGSLLGALDTYLTTATGQGMLDHYRRFAHWFVFSGDVGPQALEPWESATRSDTLPPYTAGQSAGVSHPVSWACKPQPPFSAHVWRVISPDPGRDQWLTVTAEDVTGAALVDVFVADPGVRAPGQPMPLRLLGKSGDSFEVCVPTNQSLFVMVSNPTEALQAAAKVRGTS